MQINIKATNIELTPAIKGYVEKRLSGLDKFINTSEAEMLAFVEVGKTIGGQRSGNIFRAEVQLKHPDFKESLRSVSENGDLYAAVDGVREKIKRELGKEKDKKRTLVQKGARLFKKLIPFLHE